MPIKLIKIEKKLTEKKTEEDLTMSKEGFRMRSVENQ
jgi:hypothetical protein